MVLEEGGLGRDGVEDDAEEEGVGVDGRGKSRC